MKSRTQQPDKSAGIHATVELHTVRCERGSRSSICQCPVIDSLEQFEKWLDADLEQLRIREVGWETKGSNRVWFGRHG